MTINFLQSLRTESGGFSGYPRSLTHRTVRMVWVGGADQSVGMIDVDQNYSTIDKQIDKIGNLVSIMLLEEKISQNMHNELNYYISLLYSNYYFFCDQKDLCGPLDWKLHMSWRSEVIAAGIAGDSPSKGNFRRMGAR